MSRSDVNRPDVTSLTTDDITVTPRWVLMVPAASSCGAARQYPCDVIIQCWRYPLRHHWVLMSRTMVLMILLPRGHEQRSMCGFSILSWSSWSSSERTSRISWATCNTTIELWADILLWDGCVCSCVALNNYLKLWINISEAIKCWHTNLMIFDKSSKLHFLINVIESNSKWRKI